MCRRTNEINLLLELQRVKASFFPWRSTAVTLALALALALSQPSAAGTRLLCVSCSKPYEESRRKEQAESLQPTDKAHVGQTGKIPCLLLTYCLPVLSGIWFP